MPDDSHHKNMPKNIRRKWERSQDYANKRYGLTIKQRATIVSVIGIGFFLAMLYVFGYRLYYNVVLQYLA